MASAVRKSGITADEYLVRVSQDKIRVERMSRQGDLWLMTVWDSLEGTLQRDSIACEILLSDSHDQVKFEET